MNNRSILVFSNKIFHKIYRILSIEGENIQLFSCEKTLDEIDFTNVDLVLIDCGVNIKKGLKLLKQVKSTFPNILVILLTDTSSEEFAIEAFRTGAREYLRKPINIIELQNIIKDILKIKRESKEKRYAFVQRESYDSNDPGFLAMTDKTANILNSICYIEENLAEKITLSKCAEEARLSKYHFCRQFKKCTGMRLMQFVNFMRISRAKKLLERDDLSITEVAFELGYNDYSRFLRSFKKFTGLTPKMYRNSLRTK